MIQKKYVLLGLSGLLGADVALAQIARELDPITVLARRIESSQDENASSVGVVTGEELERMQRNRLLDALELVPGVQALSTAGLTGNTGSLIVRGLPSRFQQVVVDGVTLSDTANGIGNFLANGEVGQVTNLELLRGPQSVLYGSGAGGGVLGYETAVGEGDPSFRLFGEAGSFSSGRYALSSSGQLGSLSYGLEVGRFETDNDTYTALPRHDYEQDYANLALAWQLRDDLRLKVSFRGSDNLLETTTISPYGASNAEIATDTSLFAANLYYQVTSDWESRLTLGYYDERYRGDFDGFLFETDLERATLNWTNELTLSESLSLTGGLEAAQSDYDSTGDGSSEFWNYGFFTNFYYRPVEDLLLEAGIRFDEHEEFGGNPAWNVGIVYELPETQTRFHARVSEAYRNPTLLDSGFFASPYGTQFANPDLDSEEIFGFELGVRQEFGTHFAGLTYFQQELTDAISTNFLVNGTQRVNIAGDSNVSGLEFEMGGSFLDQKLNYRLAFTAQFDEEVIDVPDQFASIDVNYDGGSWLVGTGVSYVGGASYLSPTPGSLSTDSRTLTRLYGEFEATEWLTLHARVENLFDEEYQQFADAFGPGSGVEGPGRAFYVGATLTW